MSLNPLDLTGPKFLLFYVLLFLLVISWQWLRNQGRRVESSDPALRNDPYLLAYLARGPVHAINTAAFSLIERKLLRVSGSKIEPSRADAAEFARRPLEKAIIAYMDKNGRKASLVASDPLVRKAADLYLPTLQKAGLLPGPAENLNQKALGVLLALGFGMLGAIKIYVGLSRGHHNIIILLILTIAAVFYFLASCRKRTTAAGSAMLASSRTTYKSLKSSKVKKTSDNTLPELSFQFALFGLTGLPAATYAWQEALIPENRQNNDSSGSSCSSCGSSSSGGGSGSSCSGGCGGGCGGCGG
jgi:uncharacterized protein (TIGR04222 family)